MKEVWTKNVQMDERRMEKDARRIVGGERRIKEEWTNG